MSIVQCIRMVSFSKPKLTKLINDAIPL
uniref:Uncharacterized protein n=1 Tax=Rhizophora mucronata TaxID=61149 RepID=A0A2P2QEY5_RHIMU